MRAVIMVKSGLVQEVFTDEPLDYIIIDGDCQDEDESCELLDTSGHNFRASITEYSTRAGKSEVEHYWNQIPPL